MQVIEKACNNNVSTDRKVKQYNREVMRDVPEVKGFVEWISATHIPGFFPEFFKVTKNLDKFKTEASELVYRESLLIDHSFDLIPIKTVSPFDSPAFCLQDSGLYIYNRSKAQRTDILLSPGEMQTCGLSEEDVAFLQTFLGEDILWSQKGNPENIYDSEDTDFFVVDLKKRDILSIFDILEFTDKPQEIAIYDRVNHSLKLIPVNEETVSHIRDLNQFLNKIRRKDSSVC